MGRAEDAKELGAHLETVREAMSRARAALKEATAAERILTARMEEIARGAGDSVEPPALPPLEGVEEPTILTTDHALRRTRKETLLVALAGAGVALGAVALTVVVVLALRPAREAASPAAASVTAPAPSPVRAIPPPEPAPEATAEALPPPPPVRAVSIPAPKLEAPALGAALKPASGSPDDCATRYTYDQHGIKHYKAHCLGF